MNQELKVGGIFTFSQVREGVVVDTWKSENIVTDEGLIYILDVSLSGGSPLTSWYLGLFKNNYTPLSTDTMALFPGSGVGNEATTEYSETTRPIWNEAGPVGKVITNTSSPAVFTFASAVPVYGAFLSSASTKAGTTGKLAAASKFSSVRNMLIGDVLNVVYNLTASST